MRGRALFPILQARKDNFNPLEKSAKAEEKALKILDEIMEEYISVVTRYVHGANSSGASPFKSSSDEDEIMDLSDDYNIEEDEQVVALLIEMRSFSAEEKCLIAQPEVIEEPTQALISREEEVLKSSILETEASQEKEAEVSQLDVAISEGEPSKDEESEKRKLSEIVHKVCEDVEEEEEEEKSESESEKDELKQSMQVHTNISPIQTAPADSQEISSNEGSSAEGTKLMKSMTALIATLQKNVAEM
ncbi:golgin IMH1-like [Impatiens glandulifera]|uniref:golgin IMH1-like n=1 Tax=Impatiens glandulifera TaxID=253017 RepID=UPI001FB15C30|nr:golgin IMH1-like [Impatiens glandulifera]